MKNQNFNSEDIGNENYKTKEIDHQNLLLDCKRLTESKITNTKANKKEFIDLFAYNCYRSGIPIHHAFEFAQTISLLFTDDTLTSFEIAYDIHKEEFAKKRTEEQLKPVEDFLKNTPFIPEALYLQMPNIIREGAMAFRDNRERDVFLTGALSIISGCLPGVKGVYDGKEVYPILYTFTVAPSASGKGALDFAKILGDEYHNFLLNGSRNAETQYQQELSEYKHKIYKKRNGARDNEKEPTKPIFKVLYIPANSSSAKILWHLEQNEGMGLICETEADTMGNVFKQEWGSYSDMLRKGFHHERISSSKKNNNEFIDVDNPHFSIALSGTPNQVAGLISSAEDGLFSRMLYYVFKADQKWRDVSPLANNINLTKHFKELSIQIFKMVNFLQKEETEIHLTTKQWNRLNQQFDSWLTDITTFTSEEAASIVKRLGLIMYRIAMLFTTLRKFEKMEAAPDLYCTDEDFNTAMQLVEVYQQHSILMFNNLPNQGESTQFKKGDRKQKFIEALPQEFTTKQAVEIGKKFGFSYSLVTHYLPKQVPKLFSSSKAGYYIKKQI